MTRSIDRRVFLGTSAAAGAALVLPGRASLAADRKKYGGFRMGIQSYSLRGFPVDKAIKISQELGMAHMEFYSAHFSTGSNEAACGAMKKKMAAHGMTMLGHGVNGFSNNHAANRKLFQFAKWAGIRNLSANPTEDAFDSLDRLCAEFDIRIAIHNHGPGSRYDRVVDVLNVVKDRHKNIGACADLGHYIRSAEDPVKVIHLLKGRLFGIHLKDFAEQKKRTKGVILGKGFLDVAATFKALREVEFPDDGCLSLEYEESPKDPVAEIKECLEVAAAGARKSAKE